MADLVPVLTLGVVSVLLAMAVTVTWRVARWWVRTRRILAFRASVADLARRSDVLLGQIAERGDAVRRGTLAPEEILLELAQGMPAAEALAGEARRLRGPAGTERMVSAIADELERAGRAMEGMEHGCRLLASEGSRGYDANAQTFIKRGYLNLVHARESIAHQASTVKALPVGKPALVVPRDVD